MAAGYVPLKNYLGINVLCKASCTWHSNAKSAAFKRCTVYMAAYFTPSRLLWGLFFLRWHSMFLLLLQNVLGVISSNLSMEETKGQRTKPSLCVPALRFLAVLVSFSPPVPSSQRSAVPSAPPHWSAWKSARKETPSLTQTALPKTAGGFSEAGLLSPEQERCVTADSTWLWDPLLLQSRSSSELRWQGGTSSWTQKAKLKKSSPSTPHLFPSTAALCAMLGIVMAILTGMLSSQGTGNISGKH